MYSYISLIRERLGVRCLAQGHLSRFFGIENQTHNLLTIRPCATKICCPKCINTSKMFFYFLTCNWKLNGKHLWLKAGQLCNLWNKIHESIPCNQSQVWKSLVWLSVKLSLSLETSHRKQTTVGRARALKSVSSPIC